MRIVVASAAFVLNLIIACLVVAMLYHGTVLFRVVIAAPIAPLHCVGGEPADGAACELLTRE